MGDKTILTGNQVYSFNYSKTPMTQTRTAHLPWMIQTLPIAQENKYLGIFLFYHEIVCRVYSDEYIQHIIIA